MKLTPLMIDVLSILHQYPKLTGQRVCDLSGLTKRNGIPMKPQGAAGVGIRYCKMLKKKGLVKESVSANGTQTLFSITAHGLYLLNKQKG